MTLPQVSEMFDEQQKADAMGCIYKMEFLRGILDVKDPKAYSDKEFNALVVVRTLGDVQKRKLFLNGL